MQRPEPEIIYELHQGGIIDPIIWRIYTGDLNSNQHRDLFSHYGGITPLDRVFVGPDRIQFINSTHNFGMTIFADGRVQSLDNDHPVAVERVEAVHGYLLQHGIEFEQFPPL